MDLLHEALRAGHGLPLGRAGCARRVLVAGGAGALGAEVLEQLLACGEFMQASVLVTLPISAALRGLTTLPLTELDGAARHDTGLVVFDRVRHPNGREAAFLHPDPVALPALAARLLARGVQRLVVVSPYASATLPEALKHGLATRDEQAVALLGFEHLVIVRPGSVAACSSWRGHVAARGRLGAGPAPAHGGRTAKSRCAPARWRSSWCSLPCGLPTHRPAPGWCARTGVGSRAGARCGGPCPGLPAGSGAGSARPARMRM